MIHVDVLAALEAFTKIGTFGGEEICQDYIGKAEVAGKEERRLYPRENILN
jgi:hypothetical protein